MTTASEQEAATYDKYVETIAGVRSAIIENMSPKDIAEWIASHFDDAPEDTFDTIVALADELITKGGYEASPHEVERLETVMLPAVIHG